MDRVLDLQFGSDDAAYHVILELYDRGNIVLTDYEYKIMNILRPRVQGEDKFLVRENYPIELAKQSYEKMTEEKLKSLVEAAKAADNLKKVFAPHFEFGPALLEHLLQLKGLAGNMKVGRDLDIEKHAGILLEVFNDAAQYVKDVEKKGYIIQKQEVKPSADGGEEEFLTYQEFHPFLLKQHENKPFVVKLDW